MVTWHASMPTIQQFYFAMIKQSIYTNFSCCCTRESNLSLSALIISSSVCSFDTSWCYEREVKTFMFLSNIKFHQVNRYKMYFCGRTLFSHMTVHVWYYVWYMHLTSHDSFVVKMWKRCKQKTFSASLLKILKSWSLQLVNYCISTFKLLI
jgi:hypothetical protein